MVACARTLISHEPLVHYSQVRPYPVVTFATVLALLKSGTGIRLDCSDSVTLLCKWGGLRDPNLPHHDYDGFGYTGTLLDGICPHYSNPARALPGALVVFGPGTGEHAAMVLESHPTNPLLFSHGFEGGPLAIRLHDEAQYHNPPTTFLSVAAL